MGKIGILMIVLVLNVSYAQLKMGSGPHMKYDEKKLLWNSTHGIRNEQLDYDGNKLTAKIYPKEDIWIVTDKGEKINCSKVYYRTEKGRKKGKVKLIKNELVILYSKTNLYRVYAHFKNIPENTNYVEVNIIVHFYDKNKNPFDKEYKCRFDRVTPEKETFSWKSEIEPKIKSTKEGRAKAKRLFDKGASEFKKGNNEKAIKILEESASLNPDNLETYEILGWTYNANKNHKKAVESFEKVLQYDKNRINVRKNLANLLMRTKNYKKAIPHYLEILRKKPDDANHRYNLARCYGFLNETKEVIKHLKVCVESSKKYKTKASYDPAFTKLKENSEFKNLIK